MQEDSLPDIEEEITELVDNSNHFIKNADLVKLLILYNNNPESREGRKAYEKIGVALKMIAEKLALSGNFRNYTSDIKEEMIQDSIYVMIKNLKHYDHEAFSNPFGFFTTISYNVFRQHLKRMKLRFERYVSLEHLQTNGLEYTLSDNSGSAKIDSGKVRHQK